MKDAVDFGQQHKPKDTPPVGKDTGPVARDGGAPCKGDIPLGKGGGFGKGGGQDSIPLGKGGWGGGVKGGTDTVIIRGSSIRYRDIPIQKDAVPLGKGPDYPGVTDPVGFGGH